MSTSRLWMVAHAEQKRLQSDIAIRHPVPDDARSLGLLLYDAFAGTVDDEGENLDEAIAEARKALEGTYGTPIFDASFLAIKDGRPVCLSFVTEFEGNPLLAFSATEKAYQRSGLANDLVRRSLDALAKLGYERLRLVVTIGNVPAIQLYVKLGFVLESDDA